MAYFGHIIVVCLKEERCVQKVTKLCPKGCQTYDIFWAHVDTLYTYFEKEGLPESDGTYRDRLKSFFYVAPGSQSSQFHLLLCTLLCSLQRLAQVFVHGCEKFVIALAYLFCPALVGSCLAIFANFLAYLCISSMSTPESLLSLLHSLTAPVHSRIRQSWYVVW